MEYAYCKGPKNIKEADAEAATIWVELEAGAGDHDTVEAESGADAVDFKNLEAEVEAVDFEFLEAEAETEAVDS